MDAPLTGAPRVPILKFDDFELDELRFELRRGGEVLAVRPKVLDLLAFLVRNPDKVVTKAEIFANVWPGVAVEDGSLSQAVSVLRKLIGDEAQERIRTVRGRGFTFVGRVEVVSPPPLTAPVGVGAARSAPFTAPDRVVSSVPRVPASERTFDATSVSLDLGPEDSGADVDAPLSPQLFAVLHCDKPSLGGARYDLSSVDEVEIVRGRERKAERIAESITRRLVLHVPGDAVSRAHARLVRTHDAWCVIDLDSKNGTYVNGEACQKKELEEGDLIECGRSYFLFSTRPRAKELSLDADSRDFSDDLDSLEPSLQRLRHILPRIARSDLPILVSGDSGAGKEVVARAFHERSGRTGPLVVVGSGALTADRAVEQLCGRVGSTGVAPDAGLVARAHGGSLLLDQIESLPETAQGALVRIVDAREVLPVGASAPLAADARIIAATSVELAERVASGAFRRDLFVRISAFRYELPPLRARLGDFGVLVGRMLAALGSAKADISANAGLALLRYAWPGYLHELRQCLASALALSGSPRIQLEHLPAKITAS
jgi:transcriptional regulator with AAA-type ATPase domain/DNA-binding winged helix-turn-helix (wHTH) protein